MTHTASKRGSTRAHIAPFFICLLAITLLVSALALCGCSRTGATHTATGDDNSSVVAVVDEGHIVIGPQTTPTGSDTLRVGVRANVSGFGWLNEKTGKYSGMEVDIAKELAGRMGYDYVEFKTATPETRKNMLLNDEIDCIIACYSIAATREENFDFSPAYYEDYSVIMVQDSSLFTDINDLKGCTFGTVSGSNAASQLAIRLAEIGFTDGEVITANEDNSDVTFDNFHLVQMGSYQELSAALEEGAIDAMVADGSIAQTYLNDRRHFLDFTIDKQEYGVATQKDSALSQRVSGIIQEMLDDGTVDEFIDKWN